MPGLISQANPSRRLLSRPRLARLPVATVAAAALFASVLAGCGGKSNTASTETSGATSATSGATSGAPATSGASGTSGAPAPQATPQLLKDAAKATGDLHNIHIVLETTNITTLPMESVNADVTNQPEDKGGQAVGDARVRIGPNGGPAVPKEFVVTNKTMYTKDDSGKYSSMGPADKIYDPGIVLDKDKGLGSVIARVQDPQVAGNETIDGVATVKVTGTVDAALVDPLVPQIGKGVQTLPITLYIADVKAGGGTPTTPVLVRMVLDKDQGHVTVTLSKWGEAVTIPPVTQ